MAITVTFIGLGVMGYPMAGHLAKAGLSVRVWNRSTAKADQWTSVFSGVACATIASAVEGSDLVITCVGADKDLLAIYDGPDGIIANTPSGAVLIDHTTASAGVATHLAALAGTLVWALLTHQCPVDNKALKMDNSRSCAEDAKKTTAKPPR